MSSVRQFGTLCGHSHLLRLGQKFARNSSHRTFLADARRQLNSCGVQIRRLRQIPIVGTVAFIAITNTSPGDNKGKMSDEVNLELTLQNADQLFDENHFQEVIDVLTKYPDQDNAEIQWRKARAYYSLSKGAKDKSDREKFIRQSYELIQQALEKDDKNFAIHKWMAIVLDANAELDGIKARVSQLEVMKSHINRSIELNPEDPTTWHLMGAFEFGLAELPWIQRKIVSAIFATPPTGTYEKALECFEKAENIKPGFYSSNWLMLGKCCIALKKEQEAKGYLEKAANCHVLNEDDKKSKEEATQLLKKL